MEGCSLERVLIRERLLIGEGVLIRGGVSRSGGRLLEGVLIREDAHYRGCLLERGWGVLIREAAVSAQGRKIKSLRY